MTEPRRSNRGRSGSTGKRTRVARPEDATPNESPSDEAVGVPAANAAGSANDVGSANAAGSANDVGSANDAAPAESAGAVADEAMRDAILRRESRPAGKSTAVPGAGLVAAVPAPTGAPVPAPEPALEPAPESASGPASESAPKLAPELLLKPEPEPKPAPALEPASDSAAIAEDVAGRRLPAWALWVVVALTLVGVLAAAGFAVWHLDMARRATERLYVQAVEERRALERESMRLGADREQLRGERDRLARERDRLAVERDSLVARLAQTERVLRGVGAERDSAAAAAGVAESQVTVERATNQRLASQLRVLEAENARLKADQRYLESLLPSDGSAGSISMRGVQFVPDGVPRTWRYRALLMQGGRSERVFDGSLQLVVSGVRDGKPVTLVWPRKDEPSTVEAMSVRFTRSLRVEGTVELPDGMSVKSAQLRVLEKGAVRAQQQAAL